jgi:hypothetical protein
MKNFVSQVTVLSETRFPNKERFSLEILSIFYEDKVNNFRQK